MLLLALGFLLCAVGFGLALEALLKPATERRASLQRVVSYVEAPQRHREPDEKRIDLLAEIVPMLSRIALKVTPRAQAQQLELRLASAGIRRLDAQQFLALKTVAAFLSIVLGLVIGGLGVGGLLLVLFLLGVSLVVPDAALARIGRGRAQRLSAHLPQVIDQIVISLEAGLGFDAAVSHFVRRDTSPLADEFRIMLAELRMGEGRANALKRLAERVPSDEVKAFVQTLVQSEGVGISRVSILRNQATDLRQRRQFAAEERAQKAPVKMLFPIVIFILPVIFVVILGPAFLYASRVFGSG